MICAGCALSAGAATVMWVSGRVITWRANSKRARAMAAVEAELSEPAEDASDAPAQEATPDPVPA
ncbi:MAG: hypothetical protein KC776_43550 [Myxococcales bacterium]|nr:hypothetical protein [Myxococcales bacterium]MCB9583449.1 hypothetical protein [Polyangiaceae bacterium]